MLKRVARASAWATKHAHHAVNPMDFKLYASLPCLVALEGWDNYQFAGTADC